MASTTVNNYYVGSPKSSDITPKRFAKQVSGWLILFVLAMLLFWMGLSGNIGTFVAIAINPDMVQVDDTQVPWPGGLH